MQNKKTFSSILLILGAIAVIIGIIFIVCADGDHSSNGNGLVRASTATEFGADFYTEVYQATALAANTLTDVYKLLSRAFGIFFILSGCFEICISLLITYRPKIASKTINADYPEQGETSMSDASEGKSL